MTIDECAKIASVGDHFFNEITGKLLRYASPDAFEVLIGEYNGAETACNLLFNREQCDAEWQRMTSEEAEARSAIAQAKYPDVSDSELF